MPGIVRRVRKIVGWILVSFLIFSGISSESTFADPAPTKKVLVLYSYSSDIPVQSLFQQGLQNRLRQSPREKIEYMHEYLDLARYSTDKNFGTELARFLKAKYAVHSPDLIITHFDPAAKFMSDYGEQVFPGIPAVMGLYEGEEEAFPDPPLNYRKVVGFYGMKNAVSLILQVQPKTKKIYVVTGDSPRERKAIAAFVDMAKDFSGRVEFIYLNKLPFKEILEISRQIGENSSILYLYLFRDAAGNDFVPGEALQQIHRVANVPIYSSVSIFIGMGTIGGYMASQEVLGAKVAEVAADILQGNNSSQVAVQKTVAAEYIFDWRELKRWGIDETQLPAGSRVEFRQSGIWETYRWQLIGAGLLIFLQALTITLLWVNRQRRKRAEEKTIQLNADLTNSLSMQQEMNAQLEEEIAERSTAEKAVKQEKDRLASLLDSIADEVWFADTEARFTLANPAAVREFGFGSTDSEVAQLAASLEVLEADGTPRAIEEAPPLRALKGEIVRNQEEIVRTPVSGELRYREVSASPVRAPNGEIIGSVAVVRDVTERKINEQLQAATLLKLEAALGSMADAVFISDTEGRFIHVNDAFATYHRFKNKSECLKTLHEYPDILNVYMPDGELAELSQWAVPRALRGETATNVEYVLQRKDTGEKWVGSYNFAPIRSRDGAIIGSVVLGRDITERKALENALMESEARYRAIIEQALDVILLVDSKNGEIIEANARFTEHFGYDLQCDRPLSIYDVIIDDSVAIDALLRGSKIVDSSLPMQRRSICKKNGCIVTAERSATLVRYRNRDIIAIFLRDVSDEVRREREIRRDAQMAARVQNALLALPEESDFLAITTFYQPLSYVGGDLYFMDWRYEGNLLRGFLVDATGHGLSTALHAASLHVLLREVNEHDLPLADAMRWINQRTSEYFDEGIFAGALGFELDLQVRQLRWVCAGIPRIWVDTKAVQGMIESSGMLLGIQSGEQFDIHALPINEGDSFFFMTDGLADLLMQQADVLPGQFSEMVSRLNNLLDCENVRDDATAICINIRSLPHSVVRVDGWPRTLRLNGYGDYQRLKGEIGRIIAEITNKAHSIQEVAVHEALVNAMECRDGVPRDHKARIRFNKCGQWFVARVKTSRMGFAGNAILKRLRSHPEEMFSYGEDASMGRGIPMMLSMSHKMFYNSEGTEVLLAWKMN